MLLWNGYCWLLVVGGRKGRYSGQGLIGQVLFSISIEVKNEWSYTSTAPCALVVCTGTTLPFVRAFCGI